jgi:hypothetical protein
MSGKGFILLVSLSGALAFGQNGTSFKPVSAPQSQMSAQDSAATPVNSTNPASSTLPVSPAARTNSAPATAADSTNPASPANSANNPAAVTPSSSSTSSSSTGNGAAPAGSSANAAGNHTDGSQPESYARPLADEVDIQLPPNTEMHAVLDTPLSTKTSKAGDRFSATVVDPVRGSNGSVAIPAGTRLNGEITDASQGKPAKTKPTTKLPETVTAASSLKDKGKLSVHFRDAVLPGGQTLPLNASLVSVNGTGARAITQQGKSNVETGTHSSSSFGGPLRGFAIGTMAGGGHILAIRSRDVDLPAQTGMVIRFDQASHE